jgi:lipoate-protein ligase B
MDFIQCAVHQLGTVPFDQARALQETLAEEIHKGIRPPTLLLLQHPHTYTFGRRGQEKNLLWDATELARRKITVVWTDRGGDVTYHGPGQLVGYPLVPLAPVGAGLSLDPTTRNPRQPQADYIGYVRRLEQTLIEALAVLGQPTIQLPGLTGVWVDRGGGEAPAKIAAIGVKVDARGVSRHGFALNIDPRMSYWEGIIGCGLADYPVTSLASLQPAVPSLEKVQQAIVRAFENQFHCEMIPGDALSAYFP